MVSWFEKLALLQPQGRDGLDSCIIVSRDFGTTWGEPIYLSRGDNGRHLGAAAGFRLGPAAGKLLQRGPHAHRLIFATYGLAAPSFNIQKPKKGSGFMAAVMFTDDKLSWSTAAVSGGQWLGSSNLGADSFSPFPPENNELVMFD